MLLAGQGDSAQVAQLEEELQRLELALEGRGGGAGEVGRLRREKRALQQERDELVEQVEQLQAGAGHPTGTGGGGDPVARAAELEERLRSLQMFGAMNVPGAALPEPGTTGFEALRTGPSDAELEEMQREREDLEDALEEAEQVAAAAAEENTRLEDDKAALLEEKARLEQQLAQAEAKAARVAPDAEQDNGSDVAAMKAQLARYKEEMRVLNRYSPIPSGCAPAMRTLAPARSDMSAGCRPTLVRAARSKRSRTNLTLHWPTSPRQSETGTLPWLKWSDCEPSCRRSLDLRLRNRSAPRKHR